MAKNLTEVDHFSIQIGILTVSDTRRSDTDRSGPAMLDSLSQLGYKNFRLLLSKDEKSEIEQSLRELAKDCTVVFTTGGTGFTSRDVTPEATAEVIEKQADSIAHYIRLKGLESTHLSPLSRGIAGIVGSTLIVNLPGSPKGAIEGISAISNLLPGIITQLIGQPCAGHSLSEQT